jgi:hypothetical protein
VTLVSITSNEPDNGTGDGDTTDDIQGADFGTDDREFQLRAERSGSGGGRTYTITYEAVDDCGVSTTATAEVFVPHDLSGKASMLSGFLPDGSGLDPSARTFEILLPSSPTFDATRISISEAYVGNRYGLLKPVSSRLVELPAGGGVGRVLRFDAAAARKLLGTNQPVSVFYRMAGGLTYEIRSILELSSPQDPEPVGTTSTDGG